MSLPHRGRRAPEARPIRWTRFGGFVAVGLAFLAIPPLAHVPARLVSGCGKWIAVAAVLELLSGAGFVLVFAVVFCARMSKRQSLGAALRAFGASTVLPAGGLVGPAIGIRTARSDRPPLGLVSSTIAFTILTTAPSLIALGTLGLSLWLGWPSGPHGALLTLPAAGLAWGLLAAVWLIGRSRPDRSSGGDQSRHWCWRSSAVAIRAVREGAAEARRLVAAGNWRLVGTLGYYAFDNAVLWAAFHAYGHAPALSVIAMGYLVGSLGAAVPVPAGIGVVDGGLIGALVLYGAPAPPAAAAVLLYRGVSLLLPVTFSAIAWALAPAARPRATHRRPPRSSRRRQRRSGSQALLVSRPRQHQAAAAEQRRPRTGRNHADDQEIYYPSKGRGS